MCYDTDPVASDSEDEKRIERARKEAELAKEEKSTIKTSRSSEEQKTFSELLQRYSKWWFPSPILNQV